MSDDKPSGGAQQENISLEPVYAPVPAPMEVDVTPILERWKGADWQLLPETPLGPAMNVALDEVLLGQVQRGERPPTLRFWGWGGQAVILGSFQSVRNEVDAQAAQEMGIAIVRRMSGGGAMLVQPGLTITYSLYIPDTLLRGVSIAQSYAVCDHWTVQAFQKAGINAWYAPLNDITSAEGKIGGAAQARRMGAVLHHTTIAYEMNPDDMLRVLRIGRAKLSDKGIASAAKRVSPLRRQTDLPREQLVARLIEGFRNNFGLTQSALSADDILAAEELVQSKYGTDAWTYSLP